MLLGEVEVSSTVKAVAGMRKVLLPGFRGYRNIFTIDKNKHSCYYNHVMHYSI